MSDLKLTSPAFGDGDSIPRKYGYTVENVNPPLTIEGVPAETESLALVMDDPDAIEPAGKIWDHWVVWNIDPSRSTIPEDWDPTDAVEGHNDYGEHGYGGPNPPDREHTYHFTLYAAEQRVDLEPGATKDQLETALDGTVLIETSLTGTYAPR